MRPSPSKNNPNRPRLFRGRETADATALGLVFVVFRVSEHLFKRGLIAGVDDAEVRGHQPPTTRRRSLQG